MTEELKAGVAIGGVNYGPIDCVADSKAATGTNRWMEMTLREGKNREIRKILSHFGLDISRIVRTFCETEVKKGRLVEVLPEYECAPLVFYALLPGRRLMPPKVRIFLENLGELK